jgi:hypothetical protein
MRKALFAIVAIAAAVVVLLALLPAPAQTITIKVSGPPGTKLTGNYTVDGNESEVDTLVPAEFVVTGRDVTCSIAKDDTPGDITVRISSDTGGYASVSAVTGRVAQLGFKTGNRLTSAEHYWATTTAPTR